MERPNPNARAAVFVPSVDADELTMEILKPGAGIVGYGNKDGSVQLYFEANKFDDPHLTRWDQKILKAYDRMVKLAPTVYRLTTDIDNLEQIGFLDSGIITIRKMEALTRWLQQSNMLDSAPNGPIIDSNPPPKPPKKPVR